MQPTTTATATLLAALMMTAMLPAMSVAFHDPGVPLQGSVAADDAHWAAWRLSIPGGRIEVEAQGSFSDAAVGSVGVWLMNGDGSLRGAGVLTVLGSQTTTHVQLPDPINTLVDEKEGGAGGFAGLGMGLLNLPAGEYIALALIAADGGVSGAELNVYAPAGSTVTGATDGAGAFAHSDTAFDGVVNTVISQPGVGTVKVIVDGHVVKRASGGMFALFQHLNTNNPFASATCHLSYSGPNGGGQGSSLYFIHNGPSGGYDFTVDPCVDAAAGGVGGTWIWVVGADVTLP